MHSSGDHCLRQFRLNSCHIAGSFAGLHFDLIRKDRCGLPEDIGFRAVSFAHCRRICKPRFGEYKIQRSIRRIQRRSRISNESGFRRSAASGQGRRRDCVLQRLIRIDRHRHTDCLAIRIVDYDLILIRISLVLNVCLGRSRRDHIGRIDARISERLCSHFNMAAHGSGCFCDAGRHYNGNILSSRCLMRSNRAQINDCRYDCSAAFLKIVRIVGAAGPHAVGNRNRISLGNIDNRGVCIFIFGSVVHVLYPRTPNTGRCICGGQNICYIILFLIRCYRIFQNTDRLRRRSNHLVDLVLFRYRNRNILNRLFCRRASQVIDKQLQRRILHAPNLIECYFIIIADTTAFASFLGNFNALGMSDHVAGCVLQDEVDILSLSCSSFGHRLFQQLPDHPSGSTAVATNHDHV